MTACLASLKCLHRRLGVQHDEAVDLGAADSEPDACTAEAVPMTSGTAALRAEGVAIRIAEVGRQLDLGNANQVSIKNRSTLSSRK